MQNSQFPYTFSCPWCEQGKTLADKPADIRVSCQCSVCEQYYGIDFKTLRVQKSKPHNATTRRYMRQLTATDSAVWRTTIEYFE